VAGTTKSVRDGRNGRGGAWLDVSRDITWRVMTATDCQWCRTSRSSCSVSYCRTDWTAWTAQTQDGVTGVLFARFCGCKLIERRITSRRSV